jgi:hypothetical protein
MVADSKFNVYNNFMCPEIPTTPPSDQIQADTPADIQAGIMRRAKRLKDQEKHPTITRPTQEQMRKCEFLPLLDPPFPTGEVSGIEQPGE